MPALSGRVTLFNPFCAFSVLVLKVAISSPSFVEIISSFIRYGVRFVVNSKVASLLKVLHENFMF